MMRQKRFLDLLVVVQVLAAAFHVYGQWTKLAMADSIHGVSLTWFGWWEIFLLLNLTLAYRAHCRCPSRETVQVIINYAVWLIAISGDLLIIAGRGIGRWTVTDSWTTLTAILAIVIVLLSRRRLDTATKLGVVAIACRAVPQLMLAILYSAGTTTALSGIALAAGHVAIVGRISSNLGSLTKRTDDRNRLWPMIAEAANWLTWTGLTMVWEIS